MKDRTVLWVFLAFTLGFVLPVCSCVGTGFAAMAALGQMAGDPVPTAIGVGDAVAVIRLDGAITSSAEDYFTTMGITPDRVADLLEQAATNPDIKAAVVHVNSPGGSVVASDQIYHMFLDFEKPIVIWMGETAASGGYYISCGSDYVFAHPDTLTGSIGVISQFISVEELIDEIGIDVVVITSGPRKDIGSAFREMSEEEQALWKEIIDQVYEDFVEIVAQERGLSIEDTRELADGRVYTGRQAFELGLVDELGIPSDAIAKAAELGGIEDEPRIIELRTVPSFLDMLYGFQTRSMVPTLDELIGWAGAPSLEFRLVRP
jgi:protease-4